MSTEIEPTITLTKRRDYWVAIDTETGVGGQGETREEALRELDDAVALYRGDGEDVGDEDSVSTPTRWSRPKTSPSFSSDAGTWSRGPDATS